MQNGVEIEIFQQQDAIPVYSNYASLIWVDSSEECLPAGHPIRLFSVSYGKSFCVSIGLRTHMVQVTVPGKLKLKIPTKMNQTSHSFKRTDLVFVLLLELCKANSF